MANYNRILLATDLNEDAEVINEQAVTLARSMGAKLSVVHVVKPVSLYGSSFMGATGTESRLIEEARNKLMILGRSHGIPRERQYLEIGSSKAEICHVAEQMDADLIVIGERPEHRIDELTGSTVDTLLRDIKRDILIVKIQTVK